MDMDVLNEFDRVILRLYEKIKKKKEQNSSEENKD